jgi:methionine sulfoxide reductase heme-binding subunit
MRTAEIAAPIAHTRPAAPRAQSSPPLYVTVGVALWTLWAVQLFFPLRWREFEVLRVTFEYRAVTGSALAMFVLAQWYLPYLRMRGKIGAATRHLPAHRRMGVLAPLLFMLHTPSFGYGFMNVLSACFLVNNAIALFGYDLALRSKPIRIVWLTLHIAAALWVVALGAVHIATAVYYE